MGHSDIENEREIAPSRPAEPVEERPGVGIVAPEDYPEGDRAGSVSPEPLDEEKEYERLNPGSGGKGPAVPGSGRDRDNA